MRATGGSRARAVTLAAVLALAALAGGCPLSKAPSQSDLVGQALPKSTKIRASYAAAAAAGAVRDDWLRSFKDPRLDAIVAEAIANNLDLRQAAATVEIARQTVVVVGATLWPQAGATFGGHATRRLNGGEKNHYAGEAYGTISWELDVWGRMRAARASAQAEAEAAAVDYAFARQSLAATTAKGWYAAVNARQQLELAQQNVAIYEQLLELVKQRRDAGKVADFDVAQTSADLNSAQSTLRVAQGLYSNARRALELLLGRYPAAEIEIAAAFSPLPPPVTPGLPSSLLDRRPDLVSALDLVFAAFRNQESAKLALLPTFSLSLDGGRLADKILSLLALNPWLLHGAVGASVPIFQGGSLVAKIRIATAEQQQALAAYGAAALKAFDEVEAALTSEGLIAEELAYEKASLVDRNEAVRLAKIRYQTGSIDAITMLQVQATQIATQSNVVTLQSEQLGNRINLHLALGGSFDAATAVSARPPSPQ